MNSPGMKLIAGLALLASLGLAMACAPVKPAYRLESKSCAIDVAGAECGSVTVPENYDAPQGRAIKLNVVILRSTGPKTAHAPLFELEGGPGVPVSESVPFYAGDGAVYRRNRDLVFVDMRGTGGSNPLRCPALEALAQSRAGGAMYPTDLTAACAASLGGRADLRQYTTANAVRDLDAVREALGARQIALDALSYGTTLALAYIAEHPERVSAAVLTSTAPADRTPPRFHAVSADAALTELLSACLADADCAARFPDPFGDLERARRRFPTAEEAEIFAERLRAMMYSPAGARRAPLFLSQAAQGAADAPHMSAPDIADGLYLSVTCAESFPHFDVEAARAEARRTIFGDYRLRRQSAACAVWPTAPSKPPQPERVINVPMLFVSGSWDPATPPAWTRQVLPWFPNSRHIVIEGGGHVVDGLSNLETCYDPVIVRFFDTLDPKKLDFGCMKDVRPPRFSLE